MKHIANTTQIKGNDNYNLMKREQDSLPPSLSLSQSLCWPQGPNGSSCILPEWLSANHFISHHLGVGICNMDILKGAPDLLRGAGGGGCDSLC